MTRSEIREERRTRSKARKRRRRILILSGAALVAGLLIISLFGGQLMRSGAVRPGLNRGGPVALAPDDGRDVIPVGAEHKPYSTVPATSGPHWEAEYATEGAPYGSPVRWGIWDEVLPDEVLVANLKWGGIGLHYDCPDGCPEIVKQLEDVVPVTEQLFIMSPYPGLPSTIAV
ncbi:MAG: DUF3105 domain-containing protein, partial [Gemmatimonadetes bacterium]|nr:DUF3105 domain-containing protein [Gemmatimonadota bacterium]